MLPLLPLRCQHARSCHDTVTTASAVQLNPLLARCCHYCHYGANMPVAATILSLLPPPRCHYGANSFVAATMLPLLPLRCHYGANTFVAATDTATAAIITVPLRCKHIRCCHGYCYCCHRRGATTVPTHRLLPRYCHCGHYDATTMSSCQHIRCCHGYCHCCHHHGANTARMLMPPVSTEPYITSKHSTRPAVCRVNRYT